MDEGSSNILIITDGLLSDSTVAWIGSRYANHQLVLLSAGSGEETRAYPSSWKVLPRSDLFDSAALRRDFLAFLDRWPGLPLQGGATFDQLFRTKDGYSLWWTGPGAQRHPHRGGPFAALLALWLGVRAMERCQPREVVICTQNARLAACLAGAADAAQIQATFPPNSARPQDVREKGRLRWLVGSIGWMVKVVLGTLAKAIIVRLLGGRTDTADKQPCVVTTALFPQHVRWTEKESVVWYWEPFAQTVAASSLPIAVRHFLLIDWQELRRRGNLAKTIRSLRSIPDLLAPADSQVSLRSLCRNVGTQLRVLFGYYRLESAPALRQSFRFCGVNVLPLYLPCLREAVTRAISWENGVDAAAEALRAAGAVRAVLVHDEFYVNVGMILIAACRRLGIPTVGVQHGTIYPMHLIYTLPPGQLAGAPTPDYFAAYGEFGREVVSLYGAYPTDRVVICGGPRFDPLVNHPPDRAECRRRLGLPEDEFVLLVTTQSHPWFPAAVRAIWEAVRDDPTVILCIKCWQADAYRDIYHRLAVEPGRATARVWTDQFPDLLGACDALASVSSTTLLEATLLGKPTVSLNLSGERDCYPYAEEGVSLPGRTPEEIQGAIHCLRAFTPTAAWHDRRLRFLARHLGPTIHGKASETLIQFVKEVFFSESGEPNHGQGRMAG